MLSNKLFLVVENSSCQVHSESKVKALLLFLFFFILKNHLNLSCTLASKGTTPVKINDKMTPEEVAHAKEVRDAEKYAEMKAAFDRQLREASTKKTGKNVKILDQNKYVEKIQHLEDLRNGQVKWTPNDYILSKTHRVTNVVTGPGSVVKSLVKIDPKTGSQKRYVTAENLFDSIHESHTQRTKHAGRLLTHKDLCQRYANITVEQVMMYLNLCETCAMKKGKAKKGVVVKPIVSSGMGSRAQVKYS